MKKRRPERENAANSASISGGSSNSSISDATDVDFIPRHEAIERLAYKLYEERGCAPGGEIEDWLAAEREIDALFANGTGEEATPDASMFTGKDSAFDSDREHSL